VINALLMIAAAGIGFGGSPWAGAALGALFIVLLSIPQQRDTLRGYRGEPKTDIVLSMLFLVSMAAAGSLASAWLGYFVAMMLKR
jgi:hypothetical protein